MAALQQSPVALRPKSSSPSSSAAASIARSLPLRSASSISAFLPLRLAPSLRLRPRRPRRGGATMMDTVAGSYAAALGEIAKSTGTLEATLSDVEKVMKIFSDQATLSFFANPTIGVEKKKKLIEDLASEASLQPHTANFLNIVLEMKRTDLIREIGKEFEAFYNKISGTEVAVVTSVVPLESTHLAQVAKSVQRLTKAKNVRIKTAIDPSLIAGMTVRYGASGSKFIDLSVKTQLEEIASNLEFNVELVGASL